MSGIVDADERIDFNCAVSTGLELAVTTEDYLDYVLEQPETRVIGLFLETSRRPDKLVAGFKKAIQRQVPSLSSKSAAPNWRRSWPCPIPAHWPGAMLRMALFLIVTGYNASTIWSNWRRH